MPEASTLCNELTSLLCIWSVTAVDPLTVGYRSWLFMKLCITYSWPSISTVPQCLKFLCIHGFNQAGSCSMQYLFTTEKTQGPWISGPAVQTWVVQGSTVVINHPWGNWENSQIIFCVCDSAEEHLEKVLLLLLLQSRIYGRGWGQRAAFHYKSCSIIWLFKLCTGSLLINITLKINIAKSNEGTLNTKCIKKNKVQNWKKQFSLEKAR